MIDGLKSYSVNLISNKQLVITGKGDNVLWEKANVLSNFKSPWDSKKINKIEFKALWNFETLFFCFTVQDSEIHIEKKDNSYASINDSDRVELFFRTDESLNPYYCLEIDPNSRIMDFMARPNKQFNFDWKWPITDLIVKSNCNNKGFTVEGAISINSFRELDLLKNNQIETGIYRAKYHKKKDGSFEPSWITWVDPKTELPNFHISSSFGVLNLERN